MKKTILTRVLALIGAVLAVVTMAIVPTFAYEKTADFKKSDYSKYSNVFMEGVEYKLTTSSDYTNGVAMTFSPEYGVVYHRRLSEYDITYQVPETSSNYIYLLFDTFADPSAPDPYVVYRCKKLRIRTYYGFDEEVGYDRGLQIYLDDELFLGFHYLGARCDGPLEDGRSYDSFAVGCRDVDISGNWTASNPFDLSIFVCEAWMTNFSCPYHDNYYPDCVWDFFETYDVINHKDYLGRYQSGFDDGYSVCEFDNRDMWYEEGLNTGLENGWNNGYQGGYDDGYAFGREEGELNGYHVGYIDGEAEGWKNGEAHGITETQKTVTGVKDVVFAIFDAPVKLIDGMLEFNLFGIHVGGVVKVILTLAVVSAIVVAIMKFVKG